MSFTPTTVVIDANVALAAGTIEFYVSVAANLPLDLRWSESIWTEVERNLSKRSTGAQQRCLAALALIEDPLLGVEADDLDLARDHADAKDEHVLAAALAARRGHNLEADGLDHRVVLLTNNLQDFDREWAAEHDVRVLSPDELGLDLVDQAPGALFSFVKTEPESYMADYLTRMTRGGMAGTAEALRAVYDEVMADIE